MKKIISLLLCMSLLFSGCGVAVEELPLTTVAPPASPTNVSNAAATTSPPTTTATTTSIATAIPKASSVAHEVQTEHDEYDYELIFPSNKYPETALHILGAIEQGYTDVCTIDRSGAAENRKKSLAGIDTRDGYDRDEWPMAMCEEGGAGASVAYIDASDNRGAGSWVGNQLEDYPDGVKILFIVEKPKNLFPIQNATSTPTSAPTAKPTAKPTEKPVTKPIDNPTSKPNPAPTKDPVAEVYYKNCTAVREAGADPIRIGEPGYARHLDRDGDGIGCER